MTREGQSEDSSYSSEGDRLSAQCSATKNLTEILLLLIHSQIINYVRGMRRLSKRTTCSAG